MACWGGGGGGGYSEINAMHAKTIYAWEDDLKLYFNRIDHSYSENWNHFPYIDVGNFFNPRQYFLHLVVSITPRALQTR